MTTEQKTEENPVKFVTCWGMGWWKNASELGGAMKKAIEMKKDGTVVILSETKKDGKMWGSCLPDKVCDLIKKNHGIYEVIIAYPHKLYFDIDCKNPVIDKPILPEILQMIRSIWPNGKLAISGSIVDGVKESYHLVSDTYVIHNDEERDMVKSAVKFLQSKHDAFDWKVYTKNRNMKAINQSKADGRVQQIIDVDDYRNHLICSFIPTYAEPIDCHFAEPLKEQMAIEKASRKINLAALPHLNLQSPENLNWFGLSPIDMLNLCPYKDNKNDFDFKYVHDLARFAYYNGITYDDFLVWANWTDRADGRSMWTGLHKYPPFRIDQMKKLLQFYHPALKRDQYMTALSNQFEFPADVSITKIGRLEQEHYNPDFKATILNLSMGSGKTAQTIDFLKNSIGGFCWIAHNKALVAGTLGRLSVADVECKDYLAFDAKAKLNGALNAVKNLCICAHSLHYISFEKHYHTLVIDEIESVVDAFMGDFMKEAKTKSFAIFKNLILHSKKVVLIDAFITMKTINMIRLIDPSCKIDIVCQSVVTPSKMVTFHSASEADEKKDEKSALCNALNNIIEYVKSGKRVFIFYPYKRSGASHFGMDEVENMIKTRAKCKTVAYSADTDDKIKAGLKDVNKTWGDFDVVICNQVITCGVNFDMKGFDKVFMFLASFVKPRQSIQVSARIRNLATNEIDVFYLGRQSNTECVIDDRQQMNCPVYSRLFEDSMIEDNAPRRKAFELFCQKAPYKMKRNKFVIDNDVTKEIEEYSKSDFEYRFENIVDICSGQASTIEDLIMQQDCPMYMKFQLKKYYFQTKFENPLLEVIQNAWNLNMFGVIDRLLDNDNSVFDSIKTANKWGSIFTAPTERKQIKLSADVTERVFKEFKFRTLSKTSSKNQIYKSIINTAFKSNIICSMHNADKNVMYFINPDIEEWLNPVYDLCKNYVKCTDKLPAFTIEDDQIECIDDVDADY
jgi:hypothetical protein